MKKNLSCYMCSNPAINMEHVPPKCFFPKTSNGAFAKNLIKVPSCKTHNNDTSTTDDLVSLLLYIATNNRKNDAVELQGRKFLNFESENVDSKITSLIKILNNEPRIINLEDRFRDKEGETLAFNYNRLRPMVQETFKKITCGIYFKEKNKKLYGTHRIQEFIGRPKDYKLALEWIKLKQEAQKIFNQYKTEYIGGNPQVFKYRYLEFSGSVMFEFVLYEEIVVLNSVHTTHLLMN
ncbi:hypothetical protein [Acinetobacter dispersus]|uniref:HNH endonuclease 5 domain-containing protein n=1 Tax=Acinetobacter dispersus TaxID=70348 RepID=N9N3E4_9GAMM|nr:hypothetical protein [Acinetobacter dispersus]ENW97381.1 hypothetical protein F904_00219 [Acinetobacter dispersus]